ncbi:unnamed protein product [Urochloa humidicola]
MDASTKAYAVVIAIQLIYTGMFVISKAAFDHGINTYVFMFYRQAAGSILLLLSPFYAIGAIPGTPCHLGCYSSSSCTP